MATNLSLFDDMENNFIDELREAMDKLGLIGENYVKGKAGQGAGIFGWGIDTGSLLASVTGYEALIGDYQGNFNDPDWQHARAVGSSQYPSNTPDHYNPHVEQRNLYEADNPTTVLTYFTEYPDDQLAKDRQLEAEVGQALSDGFQYMQTQLLHAVKDTLRYGNSGIVI